MLVTKLFEVRDRMTFIPVIAIAMQPLPVHPGIPLPDDVREHDSEMYLLRRLGYPVVDQARDPAMVIMARLDGSAIQCDPHGWFDKNTLGVAHMHIIENWQMLSSGDVIDAEFIRGESLSPKVSERLANPVST